jgi:phage portal protein BeeE
MRWGAEDVARLFRVPGELIGAPATGSSVTYANREQRWQDTLALYFGPMIARREAALSKLTVRGQYVRLNTGGLLRADLLTRLKAYQIGLATGTYAMDEVRALEDRPPLTGEQLQALIDAGLLGKAAPAATVDAEPGADASQPANGATVP